MTEEILNYYLWKMRFLEEILGDCLSSCGKLHQDLPDAIQGRAADALNLKINQISDQLGKAKKEMEVVKKLLASVPVI